MFARPDYAEHIGDKRLEARVRRRFQPEMEQLESRGFIYHAILSESTQASWFFLSLCC